MQKICKCLTAILAFILISGIIHSYYWLSRIEEDLSGWPALLRTERPK